MLWPTAEVQSASTCKYTLDNKKKRIKENKQLLLKNNNIIILLTVDNVENAHHLMAICWVSIFSNFWKIFTL